MRWIETSLRASNRWIEAASGRYGTAQEELSRCTAGGQRRPEKDRGSLVRARSELRRCASVCRRGASYRPDLGSASPAPDNELSPKGRSLASPFARIHPPFVHTRFADRSCDL